MSQETKSSKQPYAPRASTPPILFSPSLCPIRMAVDALLNTRKLTSESKESLISFDDKVLLALRSMFSSQKTYDFRLSRISSIINGTGILAVNIATDLTVFAEGTALNALFDEVKLIETRLRLVALGHTTNFSLMVGYEPVVNTSTPTPTNLGRLPCSELTTTFMTQKVTSQLRYRAPTYAIYGLCSDEGVSIPRICSGLNGTFSVCNVGGTPTTSEIDFNYQLLTIGRFRKRG